MNKEELLRLSELYAKANGLRINPDKKIVNFILDGLLKNKKKYGELYCPCKVVTGDREKDRRIICPCVDHKEEIKKHRKCQCGLFVKI